MLYTSLDHTATACPVAVLIYPGPEGNSTLQPDSCRTQRESAWSGQAIPTQKTTECFFKSDPQSNHEVAGQALHPVHTVAE